MKRSHKTRDSASTSRPSHLLEKPYNVQEAIARIPIIRNDSEIPMYTAVLNEDVTSLKADTYDSVTQEELYADLDRLLCTAALRIMTLQNEIRILDGGSRQTDKEVRLRRKPRAKPTLMFGSKLTKPRKVKPIQNNEEAKRFWDFVDTYATPITETDRSFLDDIIEEFDDKLYLNVPILGAHYQTDYSDESLSDEEDSAKSKKDHNKNRLGLSRKEIDQLCFTMGPLVACTLEELQLLRRQRRLPKEFIDFTTRILHDELLDTIKDYHEEIGSLQARHSETLSNLKKIAARSREKDALDREISELYQKLRWKKMQKNEYECIRMSTNIDAADCDSLEYKVLTQYEKEIEQMKERAKVLCDKHTYLQQLSEESELPYVILGYDDDSK